MSAVGTLTSNPYSVADAEEYLDYLQRVFVAIPKAQAEGRVPNDAATADFIDDLRRVQVQLRADVARAKASSSDTAQTSVSLTGSEYQRLLNMGETMQHLLTILELRKAIVLERGEGASRITQAFRTGTFTP
jgi:hypothetical protein